MAGWHHWLDGRESEWTPGDGDGQGGLVCFDSLGCKESDMTEWLNWTELMLTVVFCPPLWEPIDCTVHGILQTRIVEWVDISFSSISSQHQDRTQVSRIAGGFFTSWAARETQEYGSEYPSPSPGDLPDPGIKPGSPALQTDSLPAEVQWKPCIPPLLWTLSFLLTNFL